MNKIPIFSLFLIVVLILTIPGLTANDQNSGSCQQGYQRVKKYILYDVNPGEGFNLRRDVYMRVAVLVRNLLKEDNIVLVLPPWGPLYHWKSRDVGPQEKLPWSRFFDVKSLGNFVPVVEFEDFLKEDKSHVLGHVFYLQSFEDAWTSGKWEEKLEVQPCMGKQRYEQDKDGLYKGWFWGYASLRAANFSCLSFQGHASFIKPLIQQHFSVGPVMIDRAETLLHDSYGDAEYWKARRSMRFSKSLFKLANDFRREFLNSSDEADVTELPDDWRDERRKDSTAIGGPYVCGHLRRQDFLRGRPNDVPSLKGAAKQLKKIAKSLDIQNLFIATDASAEEMKELKKYLEPKMKVFLFQPDLQVRREIKDGGIAIVEQIVCSRSRYFVGTHESTFSYRIQEEREILNFPPDSTFNRFCPDGQATCEQPARWRIVYE